MKAAIESVLDKDCLKLVPEMEEIEKNKRMQRIVNHFYGHIVPGVEYRFRYDTIEENHPETREIRLKTRAIVEPAEDKRLWIPCNQALPPLNDNGESDVMLLSLSDGTIMLGAYIGERRWRIPEWPVPKDRYTKILAWRRPPEPYSEREGGEA